ncbi:hypothetical protein EDD86DRAFT_248913 [Gorgonomyces haynaldii]|nr:hypothetical protein EDD86DRAFT_248913 [Gorgonomyces haynaldii]
MEFALPTLQPNRKTKKEDHVLKLEKFDPEDPFPYRHYVAFHSVSNKLLAKKHLKKLKDVKPTIDNSPPKVYPHLEMRLRKLKMEEDIKRKNQILLERIAFQMVKSTDISQKQPEMTVAKSFAMDKRRRENAVEIFRRIETKSAYYNRFEWLADRRKNLGYLKNISQYPKHYCRLVEEFDNNEALVKATKSASASRPSTRKGLPKKL